MCQAFIGSGVGSEQKGPSPGSGDDKCYEGKLEEDKDGDSGGCYS